MGAIEGEERDGRMMDGIKKLRRNGT